MLPEEGLVAPGELIVGGDSHTCTYGALGAFATGMGSTDIAAAFVLGEVWLKVPSTIKIVYKGKLGPMVYAKDIMLRTVGELGIDGATYRAIEYHGTTVDELSITGRITMANMAIEAGAKNGIFHADDKAIAFVKERTDRPFIVERADADATYERVIEIDVGSLEPQVACPHTPDNVHPISDVDARRYPRRSSLHRLVHQRLSRRPAHRREDSRREEDRVELRVDRQSRFAESLDAGGERGHSHHARGSGLRGQHAGLRCVLRRSHGHARRRRARDLDDESQLRRAHGLAQIRSLSRVARNVRRVGAHRQDHRPARCGNGPVYNGSEADAATRTNTERTSIPT